MRMSEDEYSKFITRQTERTLSADKGMQSIPTQPQVKQNASQGKYGAKQTKCEIEYGRMLSMEFPSAEIIPWGVTLRMKNGHKYTPDYLVNGDGWMMLVEVKQRGKNGFRQNSYQRAKVAFDQCRVEFYNFTWRWSEKHNGIWTENKY